MTSRAEPAAISPRVICVGHTTLDATWNVKRLPEGGGKTRALSYEERGGGMAATAAMAAARLGAAAQFWGRAGHDAAGATMRGELAAWGVVTCTRHRARAGVPDLATALSFLAASGEHIGAC